MFKKSKCHTLQIIFFFFKTKFGLESQNFSSPSRACARILTTLEPEPSQDSNLEICPSSSRAYARFSKTTRARARALARLENVRTQLDSRSGSPVSGLNFHMPQSSKPKPRTPSTPCDMPNIIIKMMNKLPLPFKAPKKTSCLDTPTTSVPSSTS